MSRLGSRAAAVVALLLVSAGCRRSAPQTDGAANATSTTLAAGEPARLPEPPAPEDAAPVKRGDPPRLLTRALRNVEVTLEGVQVPLKAGVHEQNGHLYRLLEPIVRGDLDGDGAPDAVFVVEDRSPPPGPRLRYLVAALNRGGTPEPTNAEPLGERARVAALRIQSGEIQLSLAVLQLTDEACCPTGRDERRYKVSEGVLLPS
jgi:hypothetical protein